MAVTFYVVYSARETASNRDAFLGLLAQAGDNMRLMFILTWQDEVWNHKSGSMLYHEALYQCDQFQVNIYIIYRPYLVNLTHVNSVCTLGNYILLVSRTMCQKGCI